MAKQLYIGHQQPEDQAVVSDIFAKLGESFGLKPGGKDEDEFLVPENLVSVIERVVQDYAGTAGASVVCHWSELPQETTFDCADGLTAESIGFAASTQWALERIQPSAAYGSIVSAGGIQKWVPPGLSQVHRLAKHNGMDAFHLEFESGDHLDVAVHYFYQFQERKHVRALVFLSASVPSTPW